MITTEQRAKAHADLESGIGDVAEMANVCRIMIERFAAELRLLRDDKFMISPSLLVGEIEPVEFCVLQLHHMAHELRNEYHAPIDKAS